MKQLSATERFDAWSHVGTTAHTGTALAAPGDASGMHKYSSSGYRTLLALMRRETLTAAGK